MMIAIVCSEFNSKITDGLLEGCLMALNEDGVSSEKIDIYKVPGAFELPGKIKFLSKKKNASITATELRRQNPPTKINTYVLDNI